MKFILIISTFLFFAAASYAQTPEELIERGNERIKSQATLYKGLSDLVQAKSLYLGKTEPLVANKESEKVIEILNKALAINMDFSEVPPKEEFLLLKFADRLNNLAIYKHRMMAYFRLDRFDEAVEDATWLIDHKSDGIGQIYFFRGVFYFKQSDYENALPDFKRTLKYDPKDSQTYFYLGKVYSEQEKWKLAIANYTKCLALDKSFHSVYVLRGFAYVKDGQFKIAIPDLTKAIRHNPDNVFNYFYRGTAYKETGQKQKALADFKKVLEMEPDFGNAKKAIQELEK